MLHTASTLIVLLCWPVYLLMFLGRGGPGTERQRKDTFSTLGIALQGAGVAIVWGWRRPIFSLPGSLTFPISFAAPIMAVVIAVGSVWFSWIALKTLGKQWSFVAGVTAQHRLIQGGPYAIVRHPLYLCFFGLTLATAMVWTDPYGMWIGSVLFWLGVSIRVRSEEKILRDTFGAEFDEYARRVPAFLPKTITR